jgi:hypothetical protein
MISKSTINLQFLKDSSLSRASSLKDLDSNDTSNFHMKRSDEYLIQQALAQQLRSMDINSTATDHWVDSFMNISKSVTEKTSNETKDEPEKLEKRDVSIQSWIALGLAAVGELGVVVSGVVPYCRNRVGNDSFFSATWECVMLGISIIILFDSVAVYSGNFSGVERVASAFLKPESRLAIRDFDSPDFYNAGNFVNFTDVSQHAAAKGLDISYIAYSGAALFSDSSVLLQDPVLTFSLAGQPLINHIIEADGSMSKSIDSFSHIEGDLERISKRDYVGENEYNAVYFSQGGLLTQYCKYDGYSETLTAPKDLQMMYNAVDSMPGYWYYTNHRHHWIVKDNNHNVDVSEGLLQLYSSAFVTEAFVPTYSLCKSDHDEL